MGSVEGEKKCFVMICNDKTEGICIREKIMGTVKTREEYLEGIEEGTEGLLWNYNSEELIGIFRAREKPRDRSNEPDPWRGTGKQPYPIQFRVSLRIPTQRMNSSLNLRCIKRKH
jgi:hypothetical protein